MSTHQNVGCTVFIWNVINWCHPIKSGKKIRANQQDDTKLYVNPLT